MVGAAGRERTARGRRQFGCLGYAVCAEEIMPEEQGLRLRFGRIIVPNGNSDTHAGLAAGLKAAATSPPDRIVHRARPDLDGAGGHR